MTSTRTILRTPGLDNSARQLFESYVAGYVHRINNETFRADLNEVHLDYALTSGSALLSEDSNSMVLPVFAFESMPKRLSRYFVLQSLALLFFEEDTEQYWSSIAKFEPNCKFLKRQFEICFERNVKEALFRCGEVNVPTSIWARPRIPRILVGKANSEYSSEIAGHCDDLIAQIDNSGKTKQSTFLYNSGKEYKTNIKTNTKSGAVALSV